LLSIFSLVLSDVLKEHCEDLENRLKELEMQNNILKDKLQCGFTSFEGQRKSTAEELSDVLKEHCEDLENRFKEVEAENNELKKKLITNSSTNDEPLICYFAFQALSICFLNLHNAP
jgi:chromosome segregation ATPase